MSGKNVGKIVMILFAVGALVLVGWKNGRKSGVGRSGLVERTQGMEKISNAAVCLKDLNDRNRKLATTSVNGMASAFPWSDKISFGYSTADGGVVVARDVQLGTAEKIIPASELKKLTGLARDKNHKQIILGSNALFVYSDNTIVTADIASCRLSGVYLPDELGRVHRRVRDTVQMNLHVAQDKCDKTVKCGCGHSGGDRVYCEPGFVAGDTLFQTVRSSQKAECDRKCKSNSNAKRRGYNAGFEYDCGCGTNCLGRC